MFHNSLALIVAKFAVMGLGFLFWLVAARLFETREVGLAGGVVSAMMLCTQLALMGVGSSLITLLARDRSDPKTLLDAAIGVVILASVLASIIFLILSKTLLTELSVVAGSVGFALAFLATTVVGTLGIILDQVSTVFRRGHQALHRNALSGVITLTHLLLLALLSIDASAQALFATWMTGGIGMVVLGFRQLRKSVPGGYRYRTIPDNALVRSLLRIGLPNHLLTLAERAPGFILPIMVTEISSPAANAYWYAAWMMAWVVYIIPIQVGITLFAEVSHDPAALTSLVRRGIKNSLGVGAIAAAGVAFLGPVMLSFLGSDYAASATTPLRILLLGLLPLTLIQAYFALCRATRRFGEAIAAGTLGGLVGVLAAGAAASGSGLVGMAAAWVISQSLLGVVTTARLVSLMRGVETTPQTGTDISHRAEVAGVAP